MPEPGLLGREVMDVLRKKRQRRLMLIPERERGCLIRGARMSDLDVQPLARDAALQRKAFQGLLDILLQLGNPFIAV